jgi:Ca2+-transporting ATPase
MRQPGVVNERPQQAAGLTSAEVTNRLREFGANEVPRPPRVPLWSRVSGQLRDPLILVLLAAAALTAAIGDIPDLTVIMLVVIVNSTVGVWQELRADRAVEALAAMTVPTSRVIRDRAEHEIASIEIVPGDLVLLGEGDVVPADGLVVESASLRIDESALTGESVPVDKQAGGGADEAAAWAGTVVVHGRGRMVVTRTGATSTLGRIAGMLDSRPPPTPLQRRMAELSRILAAAAVLLCLLVFVLGLVRGQSLELMAITAVSLAVAAVPESLPAVVTLSLALAATRMARRNAIVRRLPAVETLGSVTVLATDKTGTLTEGRMVVERLWLPNGDVVAGSAQAVSGRFFRDGRPVDAEDDHDVATLLRAGVLCSDATLLADGRAAGDPTEVAILRAAAAVGLDEQVVEASQPRVAEIPFDSRRKRMSTLHADGTGNWLVVCKGAPEQMLADGVVRGAGDVLEAARTRAHQWAADGLRVLAIATAAHDDLPAVDEIEHGLTLLGLVGIFDPPRDAAQDTIGACRRAGVVPVLVTGDHAATATAIAGRVGIAESPGNAVDLTGLTGPALERSADATVLARATPEHKLELVETWQRRGDVVAMTGDGVNDGPALRRADIGVAMGRRGTEVARQAADLVLADDDLGTVVAAIEEGRRVYANIRRFLLYGISGGAAEILVMIFGPAAGMAVPLLPAQILWINLLTHGLVGVALGAEPVDPARMQEPPRPPTQSVLGAGLWQRIAVASVAVATASFASAIWATEDPSPSQTILFLTLGASQLAVALAVRAPRRRLADDPWLFLAVLGAAALLAAAVVLAPLREMLDLSVPGLRGVLACLVGAMATYVLVRLMLRPARSRR